MGDFLGLNFLSEFLRVKVKVFFYVWQLTILPALSKKLTSEFKAVSCRVILRGEMELAKSQARGIYK